MRRAFLTVLCTLLLIMTRSGFTASAQIEVIDATLMSQTLTPISRDNASDIQELATWTVEGAVDMDWVGDRLAVVVPNAVLVYDTRDLAQAPSRIEVDAQEVVINPQGTLLAAASDTQVRVWAFNAGTFTATLNGTSPLAFSSTLLAFSDGDDAVYLWDSASESVRATLIGHTDRITAAVFSPNEQSISTASLDTTLRLWSVQTGEQTRFSRSRRSPISSIHFSPSGALLASGTQTGILRINNLAVDTERILSRSLRANVTSVDFNPQTSLMLFAAGVNVQLWDTGASAATVVLPNPVGTVLEATFNLAGTLILTLDAAGTLRLWGIPT